MAATAPPGLSEDGLTPSAEPEALKAAPRVAIFRTQLFKPSETFIRAQVSHLTRYDAAFVGRRLLGPDPQVHPVIASPQPIKLAGSVAYALGFLPGVYRGLAQWRPSVMHSHFAVDAILALRFCRQLDIPLITTLHGFDVTRTERDFILSGRPTLINAVLWRRRLQRRGQLFLCVSEFIRRAAIARGFPQDRLRVHYIGIDTNALKERGGPGESGLVVHVGRLVEKKGTLHLLRAVAIASQRVAGLRLVIIGDGPLRASLQHESQRLGIGEQVTFLGALPNADVIAWMARAAVVAVPSVMARDGDAEGFGIVNLEASAQGVPVVGYDSGGISEAIANGHTGLLAPEGDVSGLAHRLVSLMQNDSMRETIGREAAAFVRRRFDISRQTEVLERYYDDILEEHRGSSM